MSEERRVGGPGPASWGRWLPVVVVLLGASVWFLVAVVPQLPGLVAGQEVGGQAAPGFVTDMLAAGAVAGGVVAAARGTLGGGRSRLILGGGAAGALATSIVTFLLVGSKIQGWWPDGAAGGSQMVLGLGMVALVATGVGLGLGFVMVLGPVWLRACVAAVPIVCLQSAFDSTFPAVPGPWPGANWTQAVLLGCVLGMSVVPGRRRTWAMWVPALMLVWFAQSLVPGVTAAMQQVRAGADVLRAFPLEPVLILGEHLGLTLVDPRAHGPVVVWVVALVVGTAVVGWRLRDSTDRWTLGSIG